MGAFAVQVKGLDGSAEEMVYQGVRDEMRRRGEPLHGISLIPRLPPGQVAPLGSVLWAMRAPFADCNTGLKGVSRFDVLVPGGGSDEGCVRAGGGRLPA